MAKRKTQPDHNAYNGKPRVSSANGTTISIDGKEVGAVRLARAAKKGILWTWFLSPAAGAYGSGSAPSRAQAVAELCLHWGEQQSCQTQ